MKAVILAAGKGTRLRPLTNNRPKPLLSIGGRSILEWMLLNVKDAGIKKVLIVTNYMENQVKDTFKTGTNLGLDITYQTQKNMLGTADAFRVAEKWVGQDSFLGLMGDHYLEKGLLRKIIKNHKENETSVITLYVEDTSQYGALELDGDIVTKIVEKPEKGKEPSNYANAGLYIFSSKVFEYIKKTKKSVRGEYEITESLNLMINDGLKLRAHLIEEDQWIDIGLPWMLLNANNRALESLKTKIEGKVENNVHIEGPVWIKKDSRIRSGTYIEGPVIIGEGCDIGPNSFIRPGTNLESNIRVGNGCEVKNSIILDGTHVAHLSYIGDSIIGSNCNLGAGTIVANLRFDKRNIKMTAQNEKRDTKCRKLGVIMGDNVETGVNVSFHPGIVVGEGAWIAPGITIQNDVLENVLLLLKQQIDEQSK